MQHRGERNEPYYTVFVAQKMAELLQINEEEIQKLTTNNAKKLFKEFSSFSSIKFKRYQENEDF